MRKILPFLKTNPQQIFLFDGLGALLTALLLFSILRPYHQFVGISQGTLTLLSSVAFAMGVYSIGCFFMSKNNWKIHLTAIILINSLYCILTFALLIYHFSQIRYIGIAYFLGEIIIISILILVELQVRRFENQAQ